ncbi:MAG TPA: hypothetical protein VLT16_11060 [Candidatus Limnocylindrales bacterium]|nr:hypothetical protein [Candidatus Limnocylindrales bacterium]
MTHAAREPGQNVPAMLRKIEADEGEYMIIQPASLAQPDNQE